MKFLFDVPHPEPGTWKYKFAKLFVNWFNFCEGNFYDTENPKPENPVFNFFYNYWLFPFKQNDCLCCNTVRGLLYGFIIGRFLCP